MSTPTFSGSRRAEMARANHRKKSRKILRRYASSHLEAELIAAELAEVAAQIVREAGAASDPVARRRLLVTTRRQSTRETFDVFLGGTGYLVSDPNDLIQELRDEDL